MKYITTTILGFVAMASMASADLPTTIAQLQNELSDSQKQNIIYGRARTDADFYAALKNAAWTFDGVTLPASTVAKLQFTRKDYAQIDEFVAAQVLSVPNYKTYVAAKVAALGSDTIAAYNWLQSQKLKVIQANVASSEEKAAFLSDLAAQILSAAKAKQ